MISTILSDGGVIVLVFGILTLFFPQVRAVGFISLVAGLGLVYLGISLGESERIAAAKAAGFSTLKQAETARAAGFKTADSWRAEQKAIALSEKLAREKAAANAKERRIKEWGNLVQGGINEIAVGPRRYDTIDDIKLSLARFQRLARLLHNPPKEALDKKGRAAAAKLRRNLSAFQRRELPRMRDRYGPILREELWIADGSAKTYGAGFRRVQFISAAFAANRNIIQIHQSISDILTQLRFSRAEYKWVDADVKYDYYNLDSPDDGDVGWFSGSEFFSSRAH